MGTSLLNKKQKEILAQFYSNFALAWLTFGIISPFFNPVENIVLLLIRLIVTLGISRFLLKVSLDYLK
jgi:hypothetical protein